MGINGAHIDTHENKWCTNRYTWELMVHKYIHMGINGAQIDRHENKWCTGRWT